MELAVNRFNKGLQTDTHPMTQGNESLTDCLNGTLVTMNGNEMILQNDMGNRRVNRAYLPSGYLPVGMKEFGGIIYIAAYNPITGKSQIGSFPSPLRRIDQNYQNDLGGTFNFDSFFVGNETTKYMENIGGTIKFLDSDSFLIPLTLDISIHAGDKFSIYSSSIKSLYGLVTNYNNVMPSVSTVKAYSPKNKLFTIQVGILNSLNEFVDITKTLCRWRDKNAPIKYDSSYSEIYKFNDGYFIAPGFNNENLLYTVNDANLIKARQLMAVNTYGYKLIGPMYLKINLNHITGFNYDIYGLYDDETKIAELQIDGYITYNCPDGGSPFTDSRQGDNENYITFENCIPTFRGFDLIDNDNGSFLKRNLSQGNSLIRTASIYDPSSNTYSVKITKNYGNIKGNDKKIYNFFLGVQACHVEESEFPDTLYLKGLSVEGSIDLSLLNSGRIFFKEWRYSNNMTTNETILTFSISAYPKKGQEFSNLRFKFEDITDSNNVFYYPNPPENLLFIGEIPQYDGKLPLYNGRQTLIINWDIKQRKVYKVTTYYHDSLINSDVKLSENTERWFLSTSLFNEFYHNIDDFCTTKSLEFLDKMNVKLKINSNILDNSKEFARSSFGSLISTSENSLINYGYKNFKDIKIKVFPTLGIENEELYPDFIKIENYNICVDNIKLDKLDGNTITNINLKLRDNNQSNNVSNDIKDIFNDSNFYENSFNIRGSEITGYINYYERICTKSSTRINYITNLFLNVSDLIRYLIKKYIKSSDGRQFGGIVLDKDESAKEDDHFVFVVTLNKQIVPDAVTDTDGNTLNWDNFKTKNNENVFENVFKNKDEIKIINLAHEAADLEDGRFMLTFSGNKGSEHLFNPEEFYTTLRNNNSGIKQGQLFTYVYSINDPEDKNPNLYFLNKYINIDPNGRYHDSKRYARIWYRSNDDRFILLDELLHDESDKSLINEELILNTILSVFKKDYIYCMYNEYYSETNLYTMNKNNYIFTNNYDNKVEYSIEYTCKNIYVSNLILKIGNLKFNLENNIINFYDLYEVSLDSKNIFSDEITYYIDSNIDTLDSIYMKGDNKFYIKDLDGNHLDKNLFYYEENGQLIRIENSLNIYKEVNENENNINDIIFKHNNDTPSYQYDYIHADNHGRFYFDYTGAGVIKKEQI